MKKLIIISTFIFMYAGLHAQDSNSQLQTAVAKLDNASTVKDYQQLSNLFMQIADAQKTQWLSYYYAAFCNAKIGWLKQDTDPDNIEPFARKAMEEIATAQSLLDSATQKKELSEVYCVISMANRAMVFINPQTYGRQYGPDAAKYIVLAEQANPENARALYLDGWQKFTTPKMWGGDKSKAKELLTEAKEKLETQSSDTIEPHWGTKEVNDLLKQFK